MNPSNTGQPVGQAGAVGILEQDVGCPGCGYNLRGLGSDVVDCPECGLRSDVALLLVRQWDKPWYQAPKYNLICLPVVAGFFAALGWVITWSWQELVQDQDLGMMLTVFWMAVGLAGWALASVWVYHRLDGLVSVGFAMLAHVSIASYLVGVFSLIGGAIASVIWISEAGGKGNGGPVFDLLIYLAIAAGGVGLIVLGRWIERVVAGHCIRLYLRRPTASG